MLPSQLLLSQDRSGLPPHHGENGFINTDPDFAEAGFSEMAPWILKKIPGTFSSGEQIEIPREYNDGSLLKENKDYTATWIGHSTVLIQMEGKNILTDPVWSNRVGPFKWAGSTRVTEPGLSIEKLPLIDFVLISHNHYDHLDESSIEKIVDKNPNVKFFVPLRVRDWFEERGIRNVEELDWWEGTTFNGLKIICTPAQHWSSRSPWDRCLTLWGGFWIKTATGSVWFAGDTGWGPHFAEVRSHLGAPALALLPIGAYEPRWFMAPVHMNPDEAVRAHLAVGARQSLAMHHGTFRLTDEGIDAPVNDLAVARKAHAVTDSAFAAPEVGETRMVSLL